MASEFDSSMKAYMKEIAKTPLLTPEEEVKLAKKIKKGDQAARTLMIQANLRLVVKIAQDYSGYGLHVTDLISEGNITWTSGFSEYSTLTDQTWRFQMDEW